MAQFENGSHVRFKKPHDGFDAGEEVTVISSRPSHSCDDRLYEVRGDNGSSSFVFGFRLEPAPDYFSPEDVIHRGTRVKVGPRGHHFGGHQYNNELSPGDVCVVLGQSVTRASVKVTRPGRQAIHVIDKDCLMPVDEAPSLPTPEDSKPSRKARLLDEAAAWLDNNYDDAYTVADLLSVAHWLED